MKSVFFIFLFTLPIFAQISPGKLSIAHADLEGISNCTKCHILGEGVDESKCIDCHKLIKESINSKIGFHSTKEVSDKKCWSCHSEHHGRKFRIVNFETKKFDHNSSGFKLTGIHKEKECVDCHTSKYILDPKLKKKKKTFLGLNSSCVSCHQDVHQNTLGEDCNSCHNTEKFIPAQKFEHNKTKYRLTGKHISVKCIECHKTIIRNNKKFQVFKGVSFATCKSCHKDPHKGNFGVNCKSCHITSSFKKINGKSFNHSKTKFPLLGKHQIVKCNDCHKSGIAKKIKFKYCTDCHSDFHNGEFIKNNIQTDCSTCHTEQGFIPSSFDLENHNKTKFILTGSHLAVPCNNCHQKNNKWKFKNIGQYCLDCHKNIHGNEIKNKYFVNNNCTSCHETKSWNTITFDHDKTEFKLESKHKNVTCDGCHKIKQDNNTSNLIFASLKSNCETCHKDIHFGQFRNSGATKCENCHSFTNWNAERFNHGKTNFSLKGGHEKLPCSACHKKINQNNNIFIEFKLEAFTCADCHS